MTAQSKDRQGDEEALARALYETALGTNGYPPLHESIWWGDLMDQDYWREKARAVMLKLEEYVQ
jgi:hypothetical protein